MPGERYPHIFLIEWGRSSPFTRPGSGGKSLRINHDRDRASHSNYLRGRLDEAWRQGESRSAAVHATRSGTYIEFSGEPGFDLAFGSLELRTSGIRLLNVRTEGEGETSRQLATVYVPRGKQGIFLRRISNYAEQMNPQGTQPKNAALVDSIADIRSALLLDGFWTSKDLGGKPGTNPEWVEVWLSSDADSTVGRFRALLERQHIQCHAGDLRFPERAVLLVKANRASLEELLVASDDIAEIRAVTGVASYYVELSNREQTTRAQELLQRISMDPNASTAICILDTGINSGHMLVRPALASADMHAVDPAWGTGDDDGHGTCMAGTALYGDLVAVLNGQGSLRLGHLLESAKILPPHPPGNPKSLWGYMMAQGISLAEVQAPGRRRVICMAVTAPDDGDRGKPSSWSAEVDGLAAGYADDVRRLLIISAGNVLGSDHWLHYPQRNALCEVQNPGQAWNALTVGAYTEKVNLVASSMVNYVPLAPAGGLAPMSSTSVVWSSKWPLKPEIVMEGGNVAKGPNDSLVEHDDLKILSTSRDPSVAQFAPFWCTSAATALAAKMCAEVQVAYPRAWPETVRALVIHSAEWTAMMRRQFLPMAAPTKRDYERMLRTVGYGVPNLERALYCASNSLTLISEAEIQPFSKRRDRRGNTHYVTHELHMYDLPWPRDVLELLGEVSVRMRMTLSYFIEPGPGEIGWGNRYRYPSHGLRFDVNGPGESEEEFHRRINAQARDEGETAETEGPGDRWRIGRSRNVGSVHSDTWEGRAADLASSHHIAIYPTVGWWRERHHLERWEKKTRYSLVVSVETPEESANIYIPVQQQIQTRIPIRIATGRHAQGRQRHGRRTGG